MPLKMVIARDEEAVAVEATVLRPLVDTLTTKTAVVVRIRIDGNRKNSSLKLINSN